MNDNSPSAIIPTVWSAGCSEKAALVEIVQSLASSKDPASSSSILFDSMTVSPVVKGDRIAIIARAVKPKLRPSQRLIN